MGVALRSSIPLSRILFGVALILIVLIVKVQYAAYLCVE